MNITAENWEHLSRLLDQALDLEPEKRARWLDSLAPEHEHLKEALIDLLSGSDGIGTDDLLGRIPGFIDASLAKSAPDERVGPYRLIRELGAGGMATVWLAERADGSMQRQVALKLPRLSFIDRGLADRMVRERDILSSLEHPNIARLYDAGTDAIGRPYLALEYVEGAPLDAYTRKHALTLRERLDLFLRIASAVAFAHARLIVHRDLKPTNILVKADGDVRLLDFGIARLLQSKTELEQSAHHTQFGGRALTPGYAAPEQIAGQPVTVATDVYSLGVLLYELLTGVSPYAPKRQTPAALEEAVLHDEPLLPSSVSNADAGRALRGDLDSILLKALKKAPLDRYPSVEAFALDVERYLAGQPIVARPTSRRYRAQKFMRRNALPVSAAAITLLAIVSGAAVAIWQAQVAATERDHALALSSRNKAMNDFTETLITEAATSEKPMTVSDMLARSEKLALADAGGTPENQAAILGMIARRYITLSDFAAAAPLSERALALVRNSRDGSLRSELTCEHAWVDFMLRQSDGAVRAISQELESLKADPEAATTCLLYRSYISEMAGDTAGMLRDVVLAHERYYQGAQTTLVGEGQVLGALADGYRLTGQTQQATRYFELALQKYIQAGRDRSTGASSIRNSLAMVSTANGVPKRALELYTQILNTFAADEAGSRPPASVVYNRGQALEFIGRYGLARIDYQLCRQLAQESKSFNDEFLCMLGGARIAVQLGDRALAAQHLKQITALPSVAALSADNPLLIRLAICQATLDIDEGRLDAARARLEQALSKSRDVRWFFPGVLSKAEVELRSGDVVAAMKDAQAVLDVTTSLQGGVPFSNHVGLSWLMLGRAEQARGETVQARKAYEEAVKHLSNTVDADHPELLRAQKLLSEIG